MMTKFWAFLYLAAVALIPFAIAALFGFPGGIWVAGYLTGIVTVPFVMFGAIRAVGAITDDGAFSGSAVFAVIVVLISVASALWALFWY